MRTELNHLKIATPFVWAGCIGAISFMEAWLKFTAPGVTLSTGLSIGKVVFDALNKVEIVFACVVALVLLLQQKRNWTVEIYFFLAAMILAVQSAWVLPLLSARVDLYLSGTNPPPSHAHFYFVGLEAVKLFSLLIYGFKQIALWKI